MRWPWSRHSAEDDNLPTADTKSAEDAVREATAQKAAVEADWTSVRWLATAVEVHRQENHFADLFTEAMKRRRPRWRT